MNTHCLKRPRPRDGTPRGPCLPDALLPERCRWCGHLLVETDLSEPDLAANYEIAKRMGEGN